APPAGRIDIHSHLLPGVDDGCRDDHESFDCIALLKAAGYVGTVCTPHMGEDLYRMNIPSLVAQHVALLQERIDAAHLGYRVWPGGEVRITPGVIAWFEQFGVPTLGPSRCVLLDFWEHRWPDWVNKTFTWLIQRGYQPILAHPERINAKSFDDELREAEAMGVWLQGNFRSMTGEEGYRADQLVRELLAKNRYQLMALDMHGPDSLPGRLDGLALVESEFGAAAVERFTITEPRTRLGL